MFSLGFHTSYYLYRKPVDMRNSFAGLCGIVQNKMGLIPTSNAIFIFMNRLRDKLKLLVWEENGFWIFYKRLESGTFEIPLNDENSDQIEISHQELMFIIEGIALDSVKRRKRYKKDKKVCALV